MPRKGGSNKRNQKKLIIGLLLKKPKRRVQIFSHQSLVRYAAERTWNFVVFVSHLLSLNPLQQKWDGTFALESKRKLLAHHIIWSAYVAIFCYRSYICFQLVRTTGLDQTFVFCSIVWIGSFVGLSASFGSVLSYTDMMDLLNKTNFKISNGVLSNPAACVKIMAGLVTAQLTGLVPAVICLFFDSLPVSTCPTMEHFGITAATNILVIVWRLTFYPLDFLSLVPPMWTGSLNGLTIITSLAQLRQQLDDTRNITIRSIGSWKTVERKYKRIQIYNRLLMNWATYVVTPIITAGGIGTTALLFVTVRPSGLPIFIYCWFPFLAALALLLITVLCMDGVQSKRTSEGIIGSLRSRSGFARILPKDTRLELVQRVKALRPVYLSIGEFAELSFEVPVNIWEEVLNQLVFLLSL